MASERGNGAEHRRPITVVLVDDEPLIRRALADALRGAGLELLGEAASGEAAMETVVQTRPDVVLLDLRLPGMSGIETIERLSLLAPSSRILVLTRSEQNRVIEAIAAGASGYMLKSSPPETIVYAVRATAAGETVLSPKIAGKLVERVREAPAGAGAGDGASAIRSALTVRELEIFKRLASGHSNRTIARELSLSASTVSNHISSILAKLHLENRIQAAAQAVRSGIS
jgi:two-component system nitrate/nitrite response regulator NarL